MAQKTTARMADARGGTECVLLLFMLRRKLIGVRA
jgi:hypothetical protein